MSFSFLVHNYANGRPHQHLMNVAMYHFLQIRLSEVIPCADVESGEESLMFFTSTGV